MQRPICILLCVLSIMTARAAAPDGPRFVDAFTNGKEGYPAYRIPSLITTKGGTNALGNPTAVVVRDTGRVLLMYQRYAKGFDEHKAEPGLDGPRICRTWSQHSDDDGATWTKPRE